MTGRGEILRFRGFEFDAATGELKKAGTAVALQPRPAQVLAVLSARPGELVTRDEIRDAVWGREAHLEFDQALNYCIRRIRAALGDDAKEPRFIETLARRGYRFVAPVTRGAAQPGGAGPGISVVVLPFADFSETPHEYFSDGMTEEMILELGRLRQPGLRVIARTSTMKYRGTDKSVREIGRELGVSHAVEGSVRRSLGRVRIAAQLVRTGDESQVWAGSYDADMGDVLSVQRQVAHALAREIRPELVPQAGASRPRRIDPQAVEQVLKGRYFWHRRTVADLWKGLRCFEKAIDREPGYAAAHAGLADLYLTLLDYHELSAREALAPARRAVAEALRLEPSHAEAHSTLGHLSLHDFDFAAAERAFRRAIDLNGSYTMARFYFANHLLARARFDEAIEQALHAMTLDPVAAIVASNAALIYYHAGRFDESVSCCRRALELDEGSWMVHYDLGRIHLERGEHDRAIEELEVALERSGGSYRPLAALGHAAGLAGRRRQAEEILERLARPAGGRSVWAYGVALVQLGLGRRDECLDWLERAADEHDGAVLFLKVDPRLKPVRGVARVRALLRRLGLEA